MELFVLSKENLALSQAEAERLHGHSGEPIGDLLLLDVEHKEGLAFTREIHDLLFETTAERLEADAAGFAWSEHVEPPFAVRGPDERAFAGHIWKALEAAGQPPSVDLNNPKTLITVLQADTRVFVVKLLWTNEEHFFDRRAHLRPRNHPTSLNPKLARSMINLAGSVETVLDPFCGAGGILLEGALVSRQMTGLDIDERQVKRAEENLTHYDLAATLSVGDATKCDAFGEFDAIVTDLPLGKNAKLENAKETFTQFFSAASKITETVVVAIDAAFDLHQCFEGFWEEKSSFEWYVHKGMVKKIFLLGKR